MLSECLSIQGGGWEGEGEGDSESRAALVRAALAVGSNIQTR